jgi:hypothetical protein
MNLFVVSSTGDVMLPVMSERLQKPAPVLKSDSSIADNFAVDIL